MKTLQSYSQVVLGAVFCFLAVSFPSQSTSVTFTEVVSGDCPGVLECGVANPAWSPTGDHIAFTFWSLDNRRFITASINLTPRPDPSVLNFELIQGGHPLNSHPTWSPSGQRIAFMTGGGTMWVMTSNDATPVFVTSDTDNASKFDWSPQNDMILFANSAGNIAMISAQGGAPTLLTTDPAIDGDPVWSPDGTQIAFMSRRSGNADIWTMSAAGGNLRQLTTHVSKDVTPTWSPDSKWIAFASDRTDNSDLFMVSTGNEHKVFQITTDPGYDGEPSWSPDGLKIAFVSGRSGIAAIVVASDLFTVAVEQISVSQFKELYR